MDIFVFISRFLYRIRYTLIMGVTIAALLSIYLTGFLPKKYSVTTTVFTGITSKTSLDDMNGTTDWIKSNNAHDNIINLIKSKSTLEGVSINLLAQHLINGDPDKDNNYILAKNYRNLLKIVPDDVLALVDKSSHKNTVENFKNYKSETKSNFIYAIFNWEHQHYSYIALQKIKIKRKEASDMIDISYESNDPGIATNTIHFLNLELDLKYEDLLLSTSNDVVKYFEEQLKLSSETLKNMEGELVVFNTEHGIINYEEQTKHLAALNNIFEDRYESILLENASSKSIIENLEKQMDTRTKLVKENKVFLEALTEISSINGKIAEIEIFGGNSSDNDVLNNYKNDLLSAEKKIKTVSDSLDVYKYSKEGVAITDMVTKWLDEMVKYEKSSAELKIMHNRKRELDAKYAFYSPVGPNLKSKERSVRVEEEAYLTILHHLGLAKLKQKNILLTSGTLQIVTQPEFPLLSVPRKRNIYVIAATLGAFVFICGIFLLIELIDRTMRDKLRTERLTGLKVIGAFPDSKRIKYRSYQNEIKRVAISYFANLLNKKVNTETPAIINIMSNETGEGKSYIANELKDYWKDMGMNVEYISYHKDLKVNTQSFIKASSIFDLIKRGENKPDILIVEYAALSEHNVPQKLMNEASINILVTRANRVCSISDQQTFEDIAKSVDTDKLRIYLNFADIYTVEEFTGQLPPLSMIRKLGYKLFNMGITAK